MTRTVLALAVLAAAPAAAAPADPLPALIGDRVAGAPVSCIDRLSIDEVHLIPGVGLYYRMRTGRVAYLNRVSDGATFIHDGVLPVIDRASPRLCSAEQVRLVNENSRRPVGGATLGMFIPYRQP